MEKLKQKDIYKKKTSFSEMLIENEQVIPMMIIAIGLVFMFAFVMCATGASAEQQQIATLGTFKQYECVNLLQTCANCTYVNITSVVYPNSTRAIGQVEMTKSGTIYNYTFCNTYIAGQYIVNGLGDIDGVDTVFSYNFNINPVGGPESNTLFFLIMICVSISVLILAFIFRNCIFSFISGLGLGTTGVYSMINGFGFTTTVYTQMFSLIIIGLGLIIVITSAFEFLEEMEGENNQQTSYSEDDEE